MKKQLIKIIKRKDAEATAAAKSLGSLDSLSISLGRGEAGEERRLNRKIGSTISMWVDERREKDRIDKVTAVRKMLSGEILLSPV